ncbi:MAG TPA: M35 family metallo-endopeptidase [Anaerolineales bacterium]|nr:M35 family metallo-endopeptidase [Anaerolineales bacterium]
MKSKHRFHALLFALLAALLFTSVVGAAQKDGPDVSLSVSHGNFDKSQEVLVTVTFSNPTSKTVDVLKWYTPFEGVEEPLFAVMLNGQPAPYTGPVYKRPEVTSKDYISLKAGESMTTTVNLGEFYDLSQSGSYEVFYAVAAYNLSDPKGKNYNYREVLLSEKVSINVEGRAKPTPRTPTPPPPGGGKPPRTTPTPGSPTPTSSSPGGISFNSCSASRQSLLITAHDNAKSYSTQSENYLFGISSGTSRYTTWFGAFTTTRFNTVKAHFTAIRDAFYNRSVTYDCTCTQSYYAYVYPNQPYKIYLCNAFWSAPMTGTDSKAGTLIHEMSHFNVVAGTDDFAYGQTAAMNLAINNPDNAIRNADNHEYFAENTPPRP